MSDFIFLLSLPIFLPFIVGIRRNQASALAHTVGKHHFLRCGFGPGIDIGGTLIGMHLRRVAVPVRTSEKQIGEAIVLCARTRPKFIGGPRAIYQD